MTRWRRLVMDDGRKILLAVHEAQPLQVPLTPPLWILLQPVFSPASGRGGLHATSNFKEAESAG